MYSSYKPTHDVIGKYGKKPGEFDHPNSVCYDYDNQYMVVSDTCNHRIQLFNTKTLLQFHSMFGSEGYLHGQFRCPRGICIQPFTRHLLICDSLNGRIQVFNTVYGKYTFLYQIGSTSSEDTGQFNYPKGICCDEKGHIVVADTYNHRIQEFNESGRFLSLFGSKGSSPDQFKYPYYICYNKQYKQLLVADGDNKRVGLWSYDSSSKPQCVSHIQLKNHCYSVYVDPLRNHQILIGTMYNVLVYDSRNHKEPVQILETNTVGSGLGELDHVTGLCINEQDGTLLVVDKWNHQIQLFH